MMIWTAGIGVATRAIVATISLLVAGTTFAAAPAEAQAAGRYHVREAVAKVMIRREDRTRTRCGGTFVERDIVQTAAHCVFAHPKERRDGRVASRPRGLDHFHVLDHAGHRYRVEGIAVKRSYVFDPARNDNARDVAFLRLHRPAGAHVAVAQRHSRGKPRGLGLPAGLGRSTAERFCTGVSRGSTYIARCDVKPGDSGSGAWAMTRSGPKLFGTVTATRTLRSGRKVAVITRTHNLQDLRWYFSQRGYAAYAARRQSGHFW